MGRLGLNLLWMGRAGMRWPEAADDVEGAPDWIRVSTGRARKAGSSSTLREGQRQRQRLNPIGTGHNFGCSG